MTGDNIHLLAFLFTVLMTCLGGVGVWLKVKWNSEGHTKDIEELRRDKDSQAREINELRLSMTRDYVSKGDMKEVEARIGGRIDELKSLIMNLFGGGNGGVASAPRRRAGS